MESESSLFEDTDKDFLTCSICKEIFNHPKQLKCLHNFCQDCLESLLQKGTPCKIKCPLCRDEVELKVDMVSELEDNIFLSNLCELFVVANINTVDIFCSFCSEALKEENASRCIDCSDNLCDKCAKTHTLTRLTRNHQVILISELETENLVKKAREGNIRIPCQRHPNNHLEYFCQTCQVPVCIGCTVVDHVRQNGHNLLNLQDHATRDAFKEKITGQIKQMENLIPSFEKHISIANEIENSLIKSLEKTKKDIQETTKGLIEEIETHANLLIEKVNKKAEAIQKKVEHHREAAEIRVMSATSLNKFATNLCKHGLTAEIMASAKDLLRRMSELQQQMQELDESGELRFNMEKEFKLGKVEELEKNQDREEKHILKTFAETEMAVGHYVKRGPNWPEDYDNYDNSGQDANNSIQSIQGNGSNRTAQVYFLSYGNVQCTMNSNDYWIQPVSQTGNYQIRLDYYAKNIMAIGDEVKRGLHWPPSWINQDNKGYSTGKIQEININNGNSTAVVEFGPPPNDAIQCPMYNGAYYLLPLRPFAMLTWVEF